MRPVGLADVEIVARVLMLLAPDARSETMRQILCQTEIADCFRQAHGTPHPHFGTGSLMSCAARLPTASRPIALGADELHAYAVVIDALGEHASHQ